MTLEKYMEEAEKVLLHTYNRFKIVIDKGDGVYLYDIDGKKYLDFAAGIAVFALGYNNKEYNEELKYQIDKIIHTSNLFYNVPAIRAAERVVQATGLDRVFFTNSGTEAIEGAIKTARKYAYNKDGCNDHEIIAMKHSFHGRSMGALSVTGNEHYQEAFKPMIGGIRFAEFNNIDSVKELVNGKTCAIILEPIQGEGGIYPATLEFMQGIRKICDDNDILMICDEIQCGMGRSGKMFAYQHFGIKPDIVTLAKALGCGVPVGAFVSSDKAAAMTPGDHGSTYGGNPFVTAAVNKVFELYESYDILSNVNEVSAYMEQKLDELVDTSDKVIERRGMGLMQGLVIDGNVSEIVAKSIENGLIVISAGSNVLRLVPPLVITKDDVDLMITILKKVL
ncbi:MAG: aspartate aminotransferase family protein [Eubacterium sp.]